LLEEQAGGCWRALVGNARRLKAGEVLRPAGAAGDDLAVEVVARAGDDGTWDVRLHAGGDLLGALERHGVVPLPPYLHEGLADPERYQTVYARRAASAAAPTAGLHLTPELLARLEDRGVRVARVELVVGLDTFRPVSVDDPADHVIHTERYHVDEAVLGACRAAERVVAVGTTTVRALESAAIGPLEGRSSLFIRAGFDWQVVDVLLTNFHLPRSSLLLLVDAFVGPRWRELYATALAEGYRFLSFGDAMLLDRCAP
jgi:S-adenosylmethionine:tRNA ribosyltransferase-isomerase